MISKIKIVDRMCLVMVIVVSVASGFWVVNSSAKQQKKAQEEKDLFIKRSKALGHAEKNLRDLGKILANNKKVLSSMNERIPESAGMGTFLKQLDALMKRRNISLLSVQPLAPDVKKEYTRIPIHLLFRGDYVMVYHLLHDLESMTRVLALEKLTISKPSMTQDCRVDLTASVFER